MKLKCSIFIFHRFILEFFNMQHGYIVSITVFVCPEQGPWEVLVLISPILAALVVKCVILSDLCLSAYLALCHLIIALNLPIHCTY